MAELGIKSLRKVGRRAGWSSRGRAAHGSPSPSPSLGLHTRSPAAASPWLDPEGKDKEAVWRLRRSQILPAVGNTVEIYAHRKTPSKKYLSQRHLCYHSLTPVSPGPLLAPACAVLWVQPKHAGEPNIFITASQKTKRLLSQAGPKNGYCES